MKRNLLDRVDVKEPCNEGWDDMAGTNEVRFCSHCSKNVHDLSSMTRSRAEKLVRDSGGSLCVRYIHDEGGSMLHAPQRPVQIRRGGAVAAGVLSATLALSSATFAQGEMVRDRKPAGNQNESGSSRDPQTSISFTVTGTVADTHGAVIPGAKVVLTRSNINARRTTVTNDEGVFEFLNVDASEYEIEITASGFKKHIFQQIVIDRAYKFEKDLVLEAIESMIVGELVIAGEPISCDDPPMISDKIETQKIFDLPLSPRTVTMGLIPGVQEKPTSKKSGSKGRKQKDQSQQ